MNYPEKIKDIQDELNQEAKAKHPGLSDSDVAEWKLWTFVMATAIRAIQVIVSTYKKIVDDKLAFLRPGTIGWYTDICKKFQYGYNLIIKDDGSLGYAVNDPKAQIIAAVAVLETEDSEVIIKVAKKDNDELSELSSEEKLAFSNYITVVKFTGTKTVIISTTPDMIKYDIEIYYSPDHNPVNLEENINKAISAYQTSLGFNGTIYLQQFIKQILKVSGVVTVKVNDFEAKPAGGVYQRVLVFYVTHAGYFNYDEQSSVLLTPENEM